MKSKIEINISVIDDGPAYRVLARAARDKALPLAQWQKLHDEYYERTKR